MADVKPVLSTRDISLFLTEVLKIDDIDRKINDQIKENRLIFLNEMVKAFHAHLPYHNFLLLSTDADQRRIPTWSDIKNDMMTGRGGLCFTMNVFMYVLLTSLNYNVYATIASVAVEDSNDHVCVIVSDVLQKGDQYVVDVAFGNPTFQAICLPTGEEKETKEFIFSFAIVKYIRRGDKLIRVHKSKRVQIFDGFVTEDGWAFKYFFYLKPYTFEQLYDSEVTSIYFKYINPASIFLSNLRFVQWPKNDMHAIAIKDSSILHEVSNELQQTLIDETALPRVMKEVFPALDELILSKALDTWKVNRK